MSRKLSKQGAAISKEIGRTIGKYDMIHEGDRIVVGVSGGKDSLTLIRMLKERQRWAPVKFNLHALHVENKGNPLEKKVRLFLVNYFETLHIPYTFRSINIDISQNEMNCFWCSWNRRKVLFDMADELKYNKIALGHHRDDIIETTLINIFYTGNFSTMNPVQWLFDKRVAIIRPMATCSESMIRSFAKESGFLMVEKCCGKGSDSNRAYIKDLISDIEKRSPYVRSNIFRSMARVKKEYTDIRL